MTLLMFGIILGVYLTVVAYEFGSLITAHLFKVFTAEPHKRTLKVAGSEFRHTRVAKPAIKKHYSVKYLFTAKPRAVILMFRGLDDKHREVLERSRAEQGAEASRRNSHGKENPGSASETDSQE